MNRIARSSLALAVASLLAASVSALVCTSRDDTSGAIFATEMVGVDSGTPNREMLASNGYSSVRVPSINDIADQLCRSGSTDGSFPIDTTC